MDSRTQFLLASVLARRIAHKATVNIKDLGDNTALHWAASQDRITTARLLLDNGASVNTKATDARSPLAIAVDSGYWELAELLRQPGGER
jgi:ankyrin repeat protein